MGPVDLTPRPRSGRRCAWVFASLDERNEAVAAQVEQINDRRPFRGATQSWREWFEAYERDELIALPQHRWEPVTWRKAKVHRDWHIQLDTIKYSVPQRFAGLGVDVRVVGTTIDVLADGQIIATHQQGRHRNGYVTDPEDAPRNMRRRPDSGHAAISCAKPPRSVPAPWPRSRGCSTGRPLRPRGAGPA